MADNDDSYQATAPFPVLAGVTGLDSGSDAGRATDEFNSVQAQLGKTAVSPVDLAAAVALVRALADPDREPDA
jgi:hypothetical protein